MIQPPFDRGNVNLKQVIEIAAAEVPEKAALVLDHQRVSYREMDEASNRVANALIGLGLKKGGHTAILMSHNPQWVINYLGVIKAGGTGVLLNSRLKAPEVIPLLRDCDATILITESSFSDMPFSDVPLLEHILEADNPSYKAMLKESPVTPPGIPIDDSDTAAIIYTSGVLGRQKGVVHTHASLLVTPDIVSAGVGRGRDDVIIDTVPFFYLFGLSEVLLGSLIKGATVVIIPHFTPRTVLETVERERGSIIFGVPAIHNALAMLREDVIKGYDISSLKAASTAGAKNSPRLMRMLEEKLGVTLCETYGLSELSVVSMSTIDDHKLGTVGRPICDLKVVGEDGAEVAPGDMGEAAARPPWMMKEYYKAPELTAEVIKDGWLYTGDLVRMDEDGYLEYVEKKSFIVVTPSGLKISPWEVEETLLRHPDIAEAAYVGVKEGDGGVVPTAFIVPREGHSTSPEELSDFCRQNLADFKMPKRFQLTDSIPKTGSGKIDRRQLINSEI